MTTYYVIHNKTGEMMYISEFSPPTEPYNGQGHHVYEIEMPLSEVQNNYEWSIHHQTFVPKDSNVLTKLQFLKKFTAGEYAAIKAATAQNGELDYYWQMFMVAEQINITNPDTISGVNMLATLGLITSQRATEILNG